MEVYPEHYKTWKKLCRPPVVSPKVHIGFRLAADVVDAVRATGPGYNARVEKVLRIALAKGELSADPPAADEEASAFGTGLQARAPGAAPPKFSC